MDRAIFGLVSLGQSSRTEHRAIAVGYVSLDERRRGSSVDGELDDFRLLSHVTRTIEVAQVLSMPLVVRMQRIAVAR
jgi:glycine cleavage system aminomethyltransferase T